MKDKKNLMKEAFRNALGKADKKNFEEGLFDWPSSLYMVEDSKKQEKSENHLFKY